MPPYNANPGVNTFPPLLQPGINGYAFGSYDADFPTSLMQVTNVSLTGNFATVTVEMREGDVPTTDGKISIRGTTVGAGVFNVTNVQIEVVNFDETTGIGSISFVLANADIPSAPDNGMAYMPIPEIGELLVEGQASQAFAVPDEAGYNDNGRTITWSTSYPSAPSGVTMQLQGAMFDVENQYKVLDSSNTTAGEMRSLNLRVYRFLRIKSSGISGGTLPTAVARISI